MWFVSSFSIAVESWVNESELLSIDKESVCINVSVGLKSGSNFCMWDKRIGGRMEILIYTHSPGPT